LLALKATPPSFNPGEGERIARDLFGLAVKADRLHGERDCNFKLTAADGREYLLKLFDSADPLSSECLAQVLSHLEEQDPKLPVPRLLPAVSGAPLSRIVRDGVGYDVALLSFLPGRLLKERAASGATLGQLGSILARLDHALQGFFHPTLSRALAWDMRRLPELMVHAPLIAAAPLKAAVEAVALDIKQRLPMLRSLRSQALHADCHGSNVLVDEEGGISGVLDFGDMLHGPLIFEPAIGMAELLMEGAPLAEVRQLLQGFAKVQRLALADLEVLTDLILARHAGSVLLHAYRCQHDPDGAKLLAGAAARTAESLSALHAAAPDTLLEAWCEAAGENLPRKHSRVGLDRRHALLGKGAELFYRSPLTLVRGEGVWLFDPDGARYLDVYNNVPHVGHAHPSVVRAIQDQVALLATHTRYLHDGILQYAEELTRELPPHLNACIFVNSGSEANDVAWRMAKMATGGGGALIMSNAYHGITDAIGALTPGSAEPAEPWVATMGAPDPTWQWGKALPEDAPAQIVAQVRAALGKLNDRGAKPAAFFLDSAITSSGIFDPPHAWAELVSREVRAAGALVVADEVQYGLARSGSHFWSFERRGLKPDIVTLGKPVGNGFPMGVIVANRDLIEEFQRRYGFFSTFGGNAVAAAAGLAVLSVLKRERLQENALATGSYLRSGLEELAKRHSIFGAVRGHGLLLGLVVQGGDKALAKRRTGDLVNALASTHRVLIGSEGPDGSILKLRPPMPFYRDHAQLLLQAIDAAAGTIA
jgi:4-aminobutyrate aminotransferase-like enzyme